MKQCSKCKIVYKNEEDNFCKDKTRKDGYSCLCKECRRAYSQRPSVKKIKKEYQKEYQKKYEKENGENYSTKWQKENKEKASKNNRTWYNKNIEIARKKANCRHQTKVWLKKQGIDRHNQKCEVCRDPAIIHHNDYDNFKDIKWLCPKHHRKLHKKLNKQNKTCQQTKN